MEIALSLVIAYLLGSVPYAYIIARWRRSVDLRYVDVRNVGAGAVIRQVGKRWGVVAIILDGGKGAAAIAVANAFGVSQPIVLLAGFLAVAGHNFPFWIGFRGGSGVACFMGVMMMLSPAAFGATLGVLAITLVVTRQFFTTIALASPFLIIFVWVVERDLTLLYFTVGMAIFILLRSRRRLHEIRVFTMRAYYEMKARLSRNQD
jgi:acyl phosphate:glycerol-3-phosphate acyltransferase